MSDINLVPNTDSSLGRTKKQLSRRRLLIILTVALLLLSSSATTYWFYGDKIASYLITTENTEPTLSPSPTIEDPEVGAIKNESKDLEDSLSDLDNPDLELEMPVLDINTDF